jgi:hypothetical protein
MKKFYLPVILMVVALILGSCAQIPISSSEPINNNTYSVDYLFDHDGCKVYRFYDKGKYVYFTLCKGSHSVFKPDSTQANVINSTYYPGGD